MDGKVVVIPGGKPVDGNSIQLRLVVSGNQFTALYRTELDQPFLEAARGELPVGAKEQISIQCYHGPEDREHWMRFKDFRILRIESGGD